MNAFRQLSYWLGKKPRNIYITQAAFLDILKTEKNKEIEDGAKLFGYPVMEVNIVGDCPTDYLLLFVRCEYCTSEKPPNKNVFSASGYSCSECGAPATANYKIDIS